MYSGELSLPITGTLNNVHPWSLEHPTLYTLTVRLIRPGTGGLPDRVLDEKRCGSVSARCSSWQAGCT